MHELYIRCMWRLLFCVLLLPSCLLLHGKKQFKGLAARFLLGGRVLVMWKEMVKRCCYLPFLPDKTVSGHCRLILLFIVCQVFSRSRNWTADRPINKDNVFRCFDQKTILRNFNYQPLHPSYLHNYKGTFYENIMLGLSAVGIQGCRIRFLCYWLRIL